MKPTVASLHPGLLSRTYTTLRDSTALGYHDAIVDAKLPPKLRVEARIESHCHLMRGKAFVLVGTAVSITACAIGGNGR